MTCGEADAWLAELGARWPLWISLGVLLLFVMGVSAPLADIDLPMHLATGAWIVHHRAVPHVEPFAWTRWGAPYYAYSWLPEVTYYLLYAHVGPVALRVLHGITFAASGAAIFWVGRVAGWRPWTIVYLTLLSIGPIVFIAAFVRPQALLFPLVLLAWGCGLRVLDAEHPGRWVAALALVGAAAANSHLLFPLTALPCAIAISRMPIPWRRGILIVMALLTGWIASPYGLHWVAIFRLNFGHNLLFDFPSPIVEFLPGFRFAVRTAGLAFTVVLLGITPWALRDADATTRERVVFGALWLVGLFGFGLAARALMVWWFATLPLLVRVLERLPAPSNRSRRSMTLLIVAALPLLVTIRFVRLGDWLGDGVASPVKRSVEPLAGWLDAHVRPPDRSRVLTIFSFGSYLTWRLPEYSMSVDGRTIFPDSAAAPDAFRIAVDGPTPLGPWQSAEVAIVPVDDPVAAVLDTAQGWARIDSVTAAPPLIPMTTGLWARRSWLQRAMR